MISSGPACTALATFRDAFGHDGFVLVGASALSCHVEMTWRATRDLDLAVAASRDDIVERLQQAGWSRDTRFEIRWLALGGPRVDVIPATPELIRAGAVDLPDAGMRMSLVGFDLAFQHAQNVRLSEDLTVRVPPPEVIAVLKMVSFLDRPADRKRDLEDIAHLFEGLIGPADDERFAPEVVDLDLDYTDVSAFVMGRRLSGCLDERTRGVVEAFTARLREDDLAQAWMLSSAPDTWREHPEQLVARLDAFERGIGVK